MRPKKIKYAHLLPLLTSEVRVFQVGSDDLKKAASSTEMFGNIYQTSRCQNQEENNFRVGSI
jgi:hypothetical protein